MKKLTYLLFLLLPVLFLTAPGCGESDDCGAEDILSLTEYIAAVGLTDSVEMDDSGLSYYIIDPGAPERPNASSIVTVEYEGKLPSVTSEQIFDATRPGQPVTFPLPNLIEGWQIGIPLIGAGGRIQLFVPANLAYGPRSVGSICSNSDLVFEITLVEWTDQ